TYMDMLVFKPRRAAQAIGAHGQCGTTTPCNYTAQKWINSNAVIGPLQSDKQFISGDLPSTGTDPFSMTICHDIEQLLGSTNYSAWPVCIIAYTGTGMTQTNMNNFLASVPAQQELYIVWHQEPEGDTFTNQPGCGTQTGAQAFVCEFQLQAAMVHNSPNYTPNIFVADNSAGSKYSTGNTGADCSWIVPPKTNGPDVYLVDHYEYVTV